MRFRLFVLSTPSVFTMCLKDPQKGDDSSYPELLTVRVVGWSKFPGCWPLKDKKNSPLTDNKYLLKHDCVTIIYMERNCIAFFSC